MPDVKWIIAHRDLLLVQFTVPTKKVIFRRVVNIVNLHTESRMELGCSFRCRWKGIVDKGIIEGD